jgi:hypothetical protein
MDDKTRRAFLKATAAAGAGLALAPTLLSSVAHAKHPGGAKIANTHFRVSVKGLYGKVPGVTRFDPGKVSIKVQEASDGDRPDYREYTYGSHEYEDLSFSFNQGPGNVKLEEWAKEAMKAGGSGTSLRRDISLTLLARDKSTVLRTINCFGCYPISLNAGDHGTGSDVKTITLSCNVSRIEVA